MKRISRRKFLQTSLGSGAALLFSTAGIAATPTGKYSASPIAEIKLAMLHLRPQLGEMEYNFSLLESAIRTAVAGGAQWLVTPELVLTGYRFDTVLGTAWITSGPDQWVQRLQKITAELGVYLFLGHLEQDVESGHNHNTVFVINRQGEIVARHRKINTIPVSESWSTAGIGAVPFMVDHWNTGLLICADAWPPEHAKALEKQGADLIISLANWPPGQYGPGDSWENRSLETGLPIFICNRTGVEREFDMSEAVSAVVFLGKRLVSHSSKTSSILFIAWNQQENFLINHWTMLVEEPPSVTAGRLVGSRI